MRCSRFLKIEDHGPTDTKYYCDGHQTCNNVAQSCKTHAKQSRTFLCHIHAVEKWLTFFICKAYQNYLHPFTYENPQYVSQYMYVQVTNFKTFNIFFTWQERLHIHLILAHLFISIWSTLITMYASSSYHKGFLNA